MFKSTLTKLQPELRRNGLISGSKLFLGNGFSSKKGGECDKYCTDPFLKKLFECLKTIACKNSDKPLKTETKIEASLPNPVCTKTNNLLKNCKKICSQDNVKTYATNEKTDKPDDFEAEVKKYMSSKSKSLLKKHLTQQVYDKLKGKKTKTFGATLKDCIQSGVANHDSNVGIYAPDAESYTLFAPLFDPIINEYHGGFKPGDCHPPTSYGNMKDFIDLDPECKYVRSTRVRCGRSIVGYPFNPCLELEQYCEIEQRVFAAFTKFPVELKGEYLPLDGMKKEKQKELIDQHFLFKEGDRFLQAAQASRFWPKGRGIYLNIHKTFLVWVNEEDHLRIISMQNGGNLGEVYRRMVRGVKALEECLEFSRDQRLGYLSFCPTNLGTALRASVHIKLPSLGADLKSLEKEADKFNLQVRGTRGEHTESEGGFYDVSNRRRLGLTECEAVYEMQEGIRALIALEKAKNTKPKGKEKNKDNC